MNRRQFIQRATLYSAGTLAVPSLVRGQWFHSLDGVAPANFTGADKFAALLTQAKNENWRRLPIGERMVKIGLALQGTPYVGNTLELSDDKEVCSVNMLGLDCVTFFEVSLGFARMLAKGGSTPKDLMDQITLTRYRDGRMTDYASRLHYTSDWFYDNQAKGTIHELTKELPGAERFTQTVNFMSTHPDSYRQLKANPVLVPKIAEVERAINHRKMYYVPKDKVASIEPKLKSGDILGITTTIKGIDCSHTGMCYHDPDGTLRFLHASLTKKQVTLDEELSKYLAGVSKDTGIMVARPKEA